MKRMLTVSMRFCKSTYLRDNHKGHLANHVHENRRLVHEKAPGHSSIIVHHGSLAMAGGPVIRHMQGGKLPRKMGKGHAVSDFFAARATHFEKAAVVCFGQLIPAIIPATVTGIGPFFGPSWPDSHQAEDGRAHIGPRFEGKLCIRQVERIAVEDSVIHDFRITAPETKCLGEGDAEAKSRKGKKR